MTEPQPPTTHPHPGLGVFPAEVNYGIVDDDWVVHLNIGFPFDRHGWYGTPEQAEALAADLVDRATNAREAMSRRR